MVQTKNNELERVKGVGGGKSSWVSWKNDKLYQISEHISNPNKE